MVQRRTFIKNNFLHNNRYLLYGLCITFNFYKTADEIANLTPSTQVLVAGWCLATFVLVQSYTSCLVSNLTAPRFIPLINTLEELANSHDITLVMLKYTSTASFLSVIISFLINLERLIQFYFINCY